MTRPDLDYISEHAEAVRKIGDIVASVMAGKNPVTRIHQIDWTCMAEVREAVKMRYGDCLAVRIEQSGNYRANDFPLGIGLRTFAKIAKNVVIPIWQVGSGDVTSKNLARLCWIYDQARRLRGYCHSETQVRGPVYITSVAKKLLDSHSRRSDIPMRILLERDETKKAAGYQFYGMSKDCVSGKPLIILTMRKNLISATMLRSDTLRNKHHFDYNGNVLEFSCSLPVSVLDGLKGMLLEQVIDSDAFKGSDIRITSAKYIDGMEPTNERPGLARLGLRDTGTTVFFEEDLDQMPYAA